MAPNLESFLPDCDQPHIALTSRADLATLPPEKCKQLRFISETHVASFDWYLTHGLPTVPDAVDPREFQFDPEDSDSRFKLEIEKVEVGRPTVPLSDDSKYRTIYPSECRQRKIDYAAPVHVTLNLVNLKTGEGQILRKEDLLSVPLMVLSSKCHLRDLSPAELVSRHEDHFEIGGYFIAGGNEKVIRLLNMNRRNYPIALRRSGWTKRRKGYSDAGILIRCIDKYERTSNLNLHINKFDELELVFYIRKQMFHLPLMTIVRALCSWSDLEIFREFAQTMDDEPNYEAAVKRMLNETTNTFKQQSQQDALAYLGAHFRLLHLTAAWKSDISTAAVFLKKFCLIHLDDDLDKVRMLGAMARKLFKLEHKRCMTDNVDSPESHEVLLPGHLFQAMTLEYFEDYLKLTSQLMIKQYQKEKERGSNTVGSNMLNLAVNRVGTLGQNFKYLIATGNMRTSTGLGLQQMAGLVVGAEKINWARFYSHFRCIHRGAFFLEMRTTTPRKLATAAWGFICPVHTPDGPPCGLLNHLAHTVRIHIDRIDTQLLELKIIKLGVKPVSTRAESEDLPVFIDGRLVGWIGNGWKAKTLELYLRKLKLDDSDESVPPSLEIVHCPKPLNENEAIMSPAFHLLTEPARMMRPLMNVTHNQVEMIGCMEQVWLHVAVTASEAHELTEYQELYPMAIMSELACMSPFSNMNAGARVILQTQMAKQTFGWPSYTLNFRSDNKMYRLNTPQEPVVRSKLHDAWNMDDYPLGTNLMVAVVSYTGYDLEDATCINKMSRERGLMYGTIYKTVMIDLELESRNQGYKGGMKLGCRDRTDPNEVNNYYKSASAKLDLDGLPFVGSIFTYRDPIYCYWDQNSDKYCIGRYSAHAEDAIVDSVRIFAHKEGFKRTGEIQQAALQFRIARPVNIGDKLASRHGQKGICSRLWSTVDLPWTETGMMPDMIFNPHGFPSRMTVGMMIEFLAGKAAMVNGRVYDSTPFVFDENYPAEQHFGDILRKAGLNYHGMERMYSGTSGEELEADIFFGAVYYQRLRHMVYDKFQARASSGPCDPYTRQPVKGRARGGGVRMGEMERDGLISHGCAFIARDRLLHCSDYIKAQICSKCGSILSPTYITTDQSENYKQTNQVDRYECQSCGPNAKLIVTDMPFVIKYLCAELACMNVKMTFKFDPNDLRKDCNLKAN